MTQVPTEVTTEATPFPLDEKDELFPATFKRTIACDRLKLFDHMMTESWLVPMHPFVQQHDTPVFPPVAGESDKVVYYSGLVINRMFGEPVVKENYFSSHVKVSIAGLEGTDYGYAKTTMTMADTENKGECHVTVTIERGVAWSDEEVQLQEQYLDQMLQGFAYYMETGKPVEKNQFGTHPIYSPV